MSSIWRFLPIACPRARFVNNSLTSRENGPPSPFLRSHKSRNVSPFSPGDNNNEYTRYSCEFIKRVLINGSYFFSSVSRRGLARHDARRAMQTDSQGIPGKSSESRSKAIGGLVNRALSPSLLVEGKSAGSRRVVPLRGRIRARTHLRAYALARSHELRATRKSGSRARARSANRSRIIRAHLRAPLRARTESPGAMEILSSLAHADRTRLGGEAAN